MNLHKNPIGYFLGPWWIMEHLSCGEAPFSLKFEATAYLDTLHKCLITAVVNDSALDQIFISE